jgi:pyridoxine/pyridoxamine 5'-phosphate oxidase
MDEQQAEHWRHLWRLLVRGGADRRSPLHTPVVTSIDPAGLPDARVMVLRKAFPDDARLRFHTDARSPKCAQLDGRPVCVLGYHAPENIQLRINGHASIERDTPETDAAWAASTLFARRCYLAEQAPGTILQGPASGLPAEVEGQQPTAEQIAPARPNFALLHVHVQSIDWLHLANTGHRRCRFTRAGDGWMGEWVAP